MRFSIFLDHHWHGHIDIAILLLQNGADVNGRNGYNSTALHVASRFGHSDIVKVLILNDADVNAVTDSDCTVLDDAVEEGHHVCALQLICCGAEIDRVKKPTELMSHIKDRLDLLRTDKSIGTSLMSNEERRFMWNLAYSFTIQHRSIAFKVYYKIRSFITFHGIFMATGYGQGEGSVWM